MITYAAGLMQATIQLCRHDMYWFSQMGRTIRTELSATCKWSNQPGKIVLSTDIQITQYQALNETPECTMYLRKITLYIFNSVEQVSLPSETPSNLFPLDLVFISVIYYQLFPIPAISNYFGFPYEVWNSGFSCTRYMQLLLTIFIRK